MDASTQQAYAAWVQAGGTLLALAIAVGVPIWQIHRKRIVHREKIASALLAISGVATEFLRLAKSDRQAFEDIGGDDHRSFWQIEITESAYDRLIRALERIDLHRLPSAVVVHLVATITQNAIDCRTAFALAVTEVNRLAPIPAKTLSRVDLEIGSIEESIEQLTDIARSIRKGAIDA